MTATSTGAEQTPFIPTEMKLETKIDSRGGIIFPAIVRNATGLGKGERAIIELKDGVLTITKSDSVTHA